MYKTIDAIKVNLTFVEDNIIIQDTKTTWGYNFLK